MPAAPKLTFWFHLKWKLLFIPLVGVCLLLTMNDHTRLAFLLLVVYGVFYASAAARVSGGRRGKIVRSDGSEVPRTLRNTLPATVLVAALGCLVFFYGFYLLLVLFAVAVVSVLVRPFAIRYGWFEEGRIAALLNRPRFIDDRFRGSVDPTDGAGSGLPPKITTPAAAAPAA